MNREQLHELGRYLIFCWIGLGIIGGIIYTNRNWNAGNVEMWPGDPEFVIGQAGAKTGVYVDQGPLWLVRFLYEPPWWLAPTLYLAAGIVLVFALYKVWKRGIEPDVLEEMINRAVMVSAVATAVLGLKATGLFPYLVDVIGGLAIGLSIGWLSRQRVDWIEIVDEARSSNRTQ